VPLVIGVTGHRDLVAAELAAIRELVRSFLLRLRDQFPDRPLELLSPLAEGADQLVAEIGIELGLTLTVPLPMPKAFYMADFGSSDSRQRFDRLAQSASAVYELPVIRGSTPEEISVPGEGRDRQYAQLGVFLCAHSHILLALWDGRPSEQTGGTSQVVRFHHDDVMAGYGQPDQVSRQLLADDESDLVYHIVVSRDRPDGSPASTLEPLTAAWFTSNESHPRSLDLPDGYARIFARTDEFNRDVRESRYRIASESQSLAAAEGGAALPFEAEKIDRFFRAADWLAIHYQQRTLSALRVTYGIAFVMGMMFILYSDVEAQRYFMMTFFACLAVGVLIHMMASRGDWHGKYLEYRALAEGLRIQFYWAAAGVVSAAVTKYSHDNFLQKQDIELGWIRNVMRVAGIGCDISPNLHAGGLEIAVREWIGDEKTGGQLRYYQRKTARSVERSRQMERLGQVIAGAVMVILLIMVATPSDELRNALFVVLGAMLLAMGVRKAYGYRVAEKELIKQYEFMHKIFGNARRRLETVSSDAERRQILRALGEAALDEHAEWILLHRERPMDQGGLWRMEV
jgi:hypothetical protein